MKKPISLLLTVLLCLTSFPSSLALESTTLSNGMSGEEVRALQEALITLGFLSGTADGVFGNKTENAVRRFQRKYRLTVDGLAGATTRQLLMSLVSGGGATPTPDPGGGTVDPSPSGSSLFGGNYATLRQGSRGTRVKTLQKALITLDYLSGTADGSYGRQTRSAVSDFQKVHNLKADGVAGRKTLQALETAYEKGEKKPGNPTPAPSSPDSPTPSPSPQPDESDLNPRITPPGTASIQLLSWYDQVKPALSNRQHLLIYDPSSGLSWTLCILARGRHCDAEPLTTQDTRTMVRAFGGNTWNQKGVYVRLPDGRWTVGSTHDMPHDSGSIRDNNFNGHLCVHFLRTMEECSRNDPDYGVSNQQTIRALWKSLTGQDITD